MLAAMAGCEDPLAPTAPPGPNPMGVGTLEVSMSTSDPGSDQGFIPYAFDVYLDDQLVRQLGRNDVVTLSLSVGDHRIGLSRLARGCTVIGDNPLVVAIRSGHTTEATFEVACEEVPR
jgi:hypothetical protein